MVNVAFIIKDNCTADSPPMANDHIILYCKCWQVQSRNALHANRTWHRIHKGLNESTFGDANCQCGVRYRLHLRECQGGLRESHFLQHAKTYCVRQPKPQPSPFKVSHTQCHSTGSWEISQRPSCLPVCHFLKTEHSPPSTSQAMTQTKVYKWINDQNIKQLFKILQYLNNNVVRAWNPFKLVSQPTFGSWEQLL